MTASESRPLISIITVCYQDLENVKRTCSSIAAQIGHLDIEHILVDGASTDGTSSWYRNHAPTGRNKLISSPDNGIFDAMNKGLSAASGDYISFLNAGDVYSSKDALMHISEALSFKRPAWFYTRARVVDSVSEDVRTPVGKIPYSRATHALGFATICHQTVFMKLSLLQKLQGFDETFSMAADYHLLIRAGLEAAPETDPRITVLYAAGGVSDVQVYKQLWRRHRARVNAYGLGVFSSLLDSGWTAGQVCTVYLRKRIKPMLRRMGVKRLFGKVIA